MDRYQKEYPDCGIERDPEDAMMRVTQKKGFDHEHAILAKLRAEGRSIITIDKTDEHATFALTKAAMREGYGVIYQGYLRKGLYVIYFAIAWPLRTPG